MNRITKYEPRENSMFPYQLKDDELSTKLDSIHKLGQIEDLMEKYNIYNLVELEIALDKYDHRYDDVQTRRVDENEIYNSLSNELGCPLEVVFKTLKGIIYENEFGDFCSVQRPRLYFSDDFKCWCFELFLGGYVLKLKDHKKTWWLVSDKESE